MSRKAFKLLLVVSSILFFILLLLSGLFFAYYHQNDKENGNLEENEEETIEEKSSSKSMMILIEYKDTVGLVNFVNEMKKRNITGLLLVSPDFVKSNCEVIKEVIKYDIEIIGSNPSGVFWNVSYEEQYEIISDMKNKIEACTQEPLRIIGSKYMASDENTVKVADELGIPYVIARGTTGTKATVYKPEEYDVKILSISNIELATFKFGSLCDYSFYERGGTPEDMLKELERSYEPLSEKEIEHFGKYHRVTPTTHTNIGGYLQPWFDMWLEFWDSTETDWVDLDSFVSDVDWEIPMWQVPTNRNAPYTPEKIKPITTYEDTEKVENPCLVEELSDAESSTEELEENKIVMFHNGKVSMCLDAIDFFEENDYEVEEHLNTEEDFSEILNSYKEDFVESEGVSSSFSYYPIIFIENRVFSGFNEEIQNEIIEILE